MILRAVRGMLSAGLVLACLAIASPAAADGSGNLEGESSDDTVKVGGTGVGRTRADSQSDVSDTTQQNVVSVYEDADVICALRQGSAEDGELLNEDELEDLCESDDGPTVAEIAAMVTTEFQSLHLAAPPISYQPEGDWALINMDFIVFTDAGAQELDTTILGAPVTIRATPVSYSWDFGDGSGPLVTSDQGSPYPNQTLAHVYSSASEGVVVTLTTSWQGEFRIGGGAWLPISGFATTSSATDAIEIVAMDVNLVPNEGS